MTTHKTAPPLPLLKHDTSLLQSYFTDLSEQQKEQFTTLGSLYVHWNAKLNLISRKDIASLYLHHVLHSLSVAKVVNFLPGADVLDVGTGGGFPGIPLAILFPKTHFVLVDSIGKKIKAVQAIAQTLGLSNVSPLPTRVEKLQGQYDFVLGRGVTQLNRMYGWIKDKVKQKCVHALPNGLLYLKGGDLQSDFKKIPAHHKVYPISTFFDEPFFTTKYIVHIYQK